MTSQTSPPAVDDRKTRWIIRLVLVVLLAGGFLLYQTFKYDFIPKRFGAVDAGLVYRSGQLSPRLIKDVLQDHNIKIIIDLQGENDDPAQQAEQQAVHDLGIDYHRYPLSGDGTGKIQNYASAIQILVRSKNAGKPVLIHCSAGTQRTGVAVAFYRVLVENQPPSDAYREMRQYAWNPHRDAKALEYINQHMAELAQMLLDRGVINHIPQPIPKLSD